MTSAKIYLFIYFRPKSPPNSPNPELAKFVDEFQGVYINRLPPTSEENGGQLRAGHNGDQAGRGNNQTTSTSGVTSSDIIWDWTSRPNVPSK